MNRLIAPIFGSLALVLVVACGGSSNSSTGSSAPAPSESIYVVQSGDTVADICARATLPSGMSVVDCEQQVRTLNHLDEQVLVGQHLKVPNGDYVVVSGDTLQGICASKIRLSSTTTTAQCEAAIQSMNQLGLGLSEGQSLRVPGVVGPGSSPGASARITQPTAGLASGPKPACDYSQSKLYCIYSIGPGENLASIASAFGLKNGDVTAADLLLHSNSQAFTSLEDIPHIGQKIRIPLAQAVIHTVQAGDTVDSVARTYDASVADIVGLALNSGVDFTNLKVGQELLVPNPQRFAKPVASVSTNIATEVITFAPAFTPSRTVDGECWIGSNYVHRPDAWRCMSGTVILDPCFGSSSATQVTCVTSPFDQTDSYLMRLASPLPTASGWARPDGHVWAILKADGVSCPAALGATTSVNGARANYQCSDGSVLIGDPTPGVTWTARQIVPPASGFGQSLPETLVALKTVWR